MNCNYNIFVPLHGYNKEHTIYYYLYKGQQQKLIRGNRTQDSDFFSREVAGWDKEKFLYINNVLFHKIIEGYMDAFTLLKYSIIHTYVHF